jgi:hypothetical protein
MLQREDLEGLNLNRNFMKKLEYLYCKYYAFQVRMGHRDIAPFSAALIVAFTIELYYFGLFFVSIILFTKEQLPINASYFKVFSIILLFSLIALFYFLLIYKDKYKIILKRNDVKSKSNLGAILFPLIAFLLFNVGWILKMLQNQARL